MAHIDFLDEQVAEISTEIGRQLEAMSRPPDGSEPGMGEGTEEGSIPGESKPPLTWLEAVALLDSIPGVNQQTAEKMLAEMGLDMSRFPTAGHLATWGGLAPGNYQSGGKRYSGRTTKGNEALTTTMLVAAWTAVRTKDTFLKARYHRLAARRGKKRAIVAVAHSMLVSAWHMLTNEARHVRHGLVADSHLRVPGDLTSNVKRSSDNDGLWTAMYLGAQAYRYAATQAPDARARARRALDALMRLEAITGIPAYK